MRINKELCLFLDKIWFKLYYREKVIKWGCELNFLEVFMLV